MNEKLSLGIALQWFHRALVAWEGGEAAQQAFLHLRDLVEQYDPLVLSCSGRTLFIQGYDVQVDTEAAAGISQRLTAAGIVSVLFQRHMELEDLLLLLGILKGHHRRPEALDDPEGPLGEGCGIRVFTGNPTVPVGSSSDD